MQPPGVSFMAMAASSEAPCETDAEEMSPCLFPPNEDGLSPVSVPRPPEPGMVPGQLQRASLDPPLEQKQQQ